MSRAILLVVMVLVLGACNNGSAQDVGAGFVEADGFEFVPAAERRAAPTVAGTTLEGQPLALADLQGPVVVNFWASWCGPCKQEADDLNEVAAQYAERGVQVLGVNVKDTRASAQNFQRDLNVVYPSLYDEAAAVAASFGGVGPGALPTTLVLDEQHRVAAQLFGAVSGPQLRYQLERVLEESEGPRQ